MDNPHLKKISKNSKLSFIPVIQYLDRKRKIKTYLGNSKENEQTRAESSLYIL